ncbi:prephenate dehydrogenase [Candidatus Gottesmanbacteria bacterium]|nr:prephenate dehydrogenase [Candidatus Gottesmanbacteria bacterium]
MRNFPKKIVIIGVGLIGASLALGLKKYFGAKISILGSCSTPKKTKSALEDHIIDSGIFNIKNIPKDVKLIILATPVKTSVEILKIIGKSALRNCLIMDVGSTKQFIINAANKLQTPGISFIGTHPMAGKEASGFKHADANLFRNKPWIVCNEVTTSTKDLNIVKNILTILGARLFLMDAQKHDELTSYISHVQLVLSSILINLVSGQKNWKKMRSIASNSFRYATRGASHNPLVKTDIVLTNKTNIIKALENIKKEIDKFCQMLSQSDEKQLLSYFHNAKLIRDEWLN